MLYMFSIYDSKSDTFQTPFFAQSNGTGVRMFHKLANDSDTIVGQYPSDFTLFEIGQFDDTNGTVMPYEAAKNLGLAITFQEPGA